MIIILCVLALMLSAGIAEIVVSNKLFVKLHEGITKVEQSMSENPKHFDNPDTIGKVDDVLDLWKKNRNYFFVVNNHGIMRNLDEKLISLKKQIETNAEQDAPVTLSVVMNYIHELKQDNYPNLINIF